MLTSSFVWATDLPFEFGQTNLHLCKNLSRTIYNDLWFRVSKARMRTRLELKSFAWFDSAMKPKILKNPDFCIEICDGTWRPRAIFPILVDQVNLTTVSESCAFAILNCLNLCFHRSSDRLITLQFNFNWSCSSNFSSAKMSTNLPNLLATLTLGCTKMHESQNFKVAVSQSM